MRTSLRAAFAAVALLSTTTNANNVNAGGQRGIIRAMSAQTYGMTGLHVDLTGKYDFDRDYTTGPTGSGEPLGRTGTEIDDGVAHLLSGNLSVVYGLAPLLDMGLSFPIYFDRAPWEKGRFGPGDLELTAKLAWPFLKDDAVLTHGVFLRVSFPTGSGDRGFFPRHAYYIEEDKTDPGRNLFTANTVALNPMLLWSAHFGHLRRPVPLEIHANLGAVVTKIKRGTAIVGALGFAVTPVDALTLFTEFSGESRVKHYTESFELALLDNDPVLVTPGVRVHLPSGVDLTAAADISLSTRGTRERTAWNRDGYRYATKPLPDFGFQVGVAWSGIIREPDRDGDGIIDKKDKCPKDAEDKDGFEDDDGCPDADNDADGIADAKDKCPDKPATCDGCPVLDADGDGINDDDDKCVKDPEDKDGFEDGDGCPDLDNDKDGIPDGKDKCPNEAEDKDGVQDDDGCDDTDNDGDGVLDAADKCPNVAGESSNDGCPVKKTQEIKRGNLVLKGVAFESGKATLTTNSYTILDGVIESLREWPEVRLEIQGHTDSQGSAEANRRLSQIRADAVRMYFVESGIESNRLRSAGYGENRPIADNGTADGRARNRRVELMRTD